MSTLNGRFCLTMILIASVGPLTGCDLVGLANAGNPNGTSGSPMPDFSIIDVNAASARYQEAVSPRDYLGQISAWYFGPPT